MKIQEIEKAQEKWGKGIVKIGELKDSLKECRICLLYTSDAADEP